MKYKVAVTIYNRLDTKETGRKCGQRKKRLTHTGIKERDKIDGRYGRYKCISV